MASWSAPVQSTLRVLVVDDDPLIQESAKARLAADDLRVLTADDGVDACEALSRERVDVVLLDIQLPRMNGFDLLEQIRADVRTREVPVIMITGRRDVLSIERAFELGATSFVIKPINWVLVERQVRNVVRACAPAEAPSDQLVELARGQAWARPQRRA